MTMAFLNSAVCALIRPPSLRAIATRLGTNGASLLRRIGDSRSCRSPVKLAYVSYESSDDKADARRPSHAAAPILIMHGLFGSKSNWNTLAKAIHRRTGRKVIVVDARNHGDSPHSVDMTYGHMARDVVWLLKDFGLEKTILVGHSMGGSAMMYLALEYPRLVDKLVVVDMSPIRTSESLTAMSRIFEAMLSVEIEPGSTLSETRRDIDLRLSASIPSETLRQFLLMNLVERETGKYEWRVNLPILAKNFADRIATFPKIESASFDGPTLFIGGANSDYIKREDHAAIKRLFPSAEFRYIADAGHWVQSDKPVEFLETIVNFIE